jgi:hypothetical protein
MRPDVKLKWRSLLGGYYHDNLKGVKFPIQNNNRGVFRKIHLALRPVKL